MGSHASTQSSTLLASAKRGAKAGVKPPRAARPHAAKGVRQLFDEAMKLYDAAKYDKALMAFDSILRRYPAHEPAQIQLAKTLYRLERLKDAYAVFARINPQNLDPETSYEYAWSFYTAKQWEGCLFGFQHVPKGHALFDLANYYGGICAMKIRRYDEAADMLEKAVVLPDKLARSRALYVKHVQALQLMQQKDSLAKERSGERDRLKEAKKPKDGATATAEQEKPYEHKGRKSLIKSATLAYAGEHQYLDNHGLKETTYDARVASFNLNSGFLLPLGFKMPKDRQAALGLSISVGAENRITKGNEQRIIIQENQQDLARQLRKDLGTLDEKFGLIGGGAWLETPLPEDFWFALGGDISFTYPDLARGKRFGTRDGYVQIGGTSGAMNFDASATYTQYLDEKTKPNLTDTVGKIVATLPLAEKLTSKLTVQYKVFDYLDDKLSLDGPDSSASAELGAKQLLPFGFAMALAGAYEQQTNAAYHNIPTYQQVAADGQVITGKAILTADPFSWLSLSVQQLVSRTKWSVDNPDARESFELMVPDYIEEFTAKASLNLAF